MPKIDEKSVAVVPPDALRRLLDTCKGRGFDDRRDAALMTLFIDSGLVWPRWPTSSWPTSISTWAPLTSSARAGVSVRCRWA